MVVVGFLEYAIYGEFTCIDTERPTVKRLGNSRAITYF